jgi:mycothiol synthase
VADFAIRPARPEDTDAAFALAAEWQRNAYGEVEIQREMFESSLAAAGPAFVAETEAGVVGHAVVDGNEIDIGVAPPERRRGIGTALLRTTEAATSEDVLTLTGLASEPWAAPFAGANGYAKSGEVWLMGIDLSDPFPEPEWPAGVTLRTFRGDDEEARRVKEMLDLAYAAEPFHHPRPFADWRRFMLEDPMFDAEAWFLAEAGGEIVGAALNWDEGFVKDLVVHPDWRGRGLGKALLLQTFGEFRRRGLPRVTLKTDSNNVTGAWRLYERLGMKSERTYEIFEKRR